MSARPINPTKQILSTFPLSTNNNDWCFSFQYFLFPTCTWSVLTIWTQFKHLYPIICNDLSLLQFDTSPTLLSAQQIPGYVTNCGLYMQIIASSSQNCNIEMPVSISIQKTGTNVVRSQGDTIKLPTDSSWMGNLLLCDQTYHKQSKTHENSYKIFQQESIWMWHDVCKKWIVIQDSCTRSGWKCWHVNPVFYFISVACWHASWAYNSRRGTNTWWTRWTKHIDRTLWNVRIQRPIAKQRKTWLIIVFWLQICKLCHKMNIAFGFLCKVYTLVSNLSYTQMKF